MEEGTDKVKLADGTGDAEPTLLTSLTSRQCLYHFLIRTYIRSGRIRREEDKANG